MPFYKVSGYKPIIGQTTDHFVASSEAQVLTEVKKNPVESGGFVNYSIAEIEELPPELNITCPHCSEGFISPDRVTDLCS